MVSRAGHLARVFAIVIAFQVWLLIGSNAGCSWRHFSASIPTNNFCSVCLGSRTNLRSVAILVPCTRCSTTTRRAVLDESDGLWKASAGAWADDTGDDDTWAEEEEEADNPQFEEDSHAKEMAIEYTSDAVGKHNKRSYERSAQYHTDNEFLFDGNMRPTSRRKDKNQLDDVERTRPFPLPSERLRGRVRRWLNGKGIGWIEVKGTQETVFVHNSAILSSFDEYPCLQEGEIVDFELGPDPFKPDRKVAVAVTGPDNTPVRGGYVPGQKVGWLTGDTINEIYVGNLAFKTTWWQLRDHFKSVGSVKQASIATDGWDEKNDHPFSKGWGTVRFRHTNDVRRAVRQLDGSILDGRKIYVKPYEPRTRRGDVDYDDGAPLMPGY